MFKFVKQTRVDGKIIIQVEKHLIIPFGRPKWDISKIQIKSVSTNATYFSSDTPCVYIDATKNEPVRFTDIDVVFIEDLADEVRFDENAFEDVMLIKDNLQANYEVQTASEKQFLDLYFDYCVSIIKPTKITEFLHGSNRDNYPAPLNHPRWVFQALLPLPQAHLYLEDPLEEKFSYTPENMFKVDFAFWTGERIVAIEIDGSSHIGSETHVRKDRLLQRAGVQVIHILNSEITKYKERLIPALLPDEITQFWKSVEPEKGLANPLTLPFF
ncbi:MAG: hypothetical protein J0I20_06895 [Chloroflexi bacterium]|nr:hypothetical protein [Chloroflexota bacterium]OJV95156.1 MAG: hypothetical protein BGO39_24390 [Chloroflexi bacterium 54-19]